MRNYQKDGIAALRTLPLSAQKKETAICTAVETR